MQYHSTQIDPIFCKGSNNTALILIHGFTGTPDSLRFLATQLNQSGFTVSVPLLAGHGSTKENLAKTGWKDWYQTISTTYKELHSQYNQVFVAGLSLGGVLSLKLAEDHPESISAIACLATPIFLPSWIQKTVPMITNSPLRYLYRYQKKAGPDIKDPIAKKNFWHIEDMPISCIHSLIQLQKNVRLNLSKVISPALLIHSRYDSTAPYECMNEISKNISAPITETITLENSFHIISIDYDKNTVSNKMSAFFSRFVK